VFRRFRTFPEVRTIQDNQLAVVNSIATVDSMLQNRALMNQICACMCSLIGYSWAEDKEHCEEYGRMLQADPSKVSMRAKKRGLPQVSVTRLSSSSCFS